MFIVRTYVGDTFSFLIQVLHARLKRKKKLPPTRLKKKITPFSPCECVYILYINGTLHLGKTWTSEEQLTTTLI